MRLRGKLTGLILFAAVSLAAMKEKPKTIAWSDLSEQSIIGVLGKPLGTVCKIEGVVTEQCSSGHTKADDGNPAHWLELRVTKLNEADLPTPINFLLSSGGGGFPLTVEGIEDLPAQPKAGKSFSYFAYESGSFIGPSADPDHLIHTAGPGDEAVQTNDPNFGRYHMVVTLKIVPKKD